MGYTLRYPLLVQNPYVHLVFGQAYLNDLQGSDNLSGYLCLGQP